MKAKLRRQLDRVGLLDSILPGKVVPNAIEEIRALNGVERNRLAARRWVRAVRDNALLPFTWPTPHNQVKP